jgi:hypothetical protein
VVGVLLWLRRSQDDEAWRLKSGAGSYGAWDRVLALGTTALIAGLLVLVASEVVGLLKRSSEDSGGEASPRRPRDAEAGDRVLG